MATAVRRVERKKKQKPQGWSKTALAAHDVKVWGRDEPKIPASDGELHFALMWYHSMRELSDAKEYTLEWLRANRERDVETYERVKDRWVNPTYSWMARLATRGYNMSPPQRRRLLRSVDETLSKVSDQEEDDGLARQPKRDPVRSVMVDVEGAIDDGKELDVRSLLRDKGINAAGARRLVDRFTPVLEEMREALSKKGDPQVREAYRGLEEETRRTIRNLESMMSVFEEHSVVERRVRTPRARKPRPVPVERILKNLVYKTESMDYKVRSVDPAQVIGAKELWTLDTRSKRISVYRASDSIKGLSVRRRTFDGVDESRSGTYMTGRRTQTVVDKVMAATKAGVHRSVEGLRAGTLNLRSNENTVLLRVIR